MTTANKTEAIAGNGKPELTPGLTPAPKERQPRKSPTYKLSPEQLTAQVIALSPSELRAMKKSIEEELGKREKELEAQLKEVRGEK